MIKNSILFSYKNDPKLGDYFSKCATNAISLLEQKSEIKKTHIEDDNCNFVYIENELRTHAEKSLFLIYSHGDNESFYKGDEPIPFIFQTINCDSCLNGGLIYTNACSTGIEFGKNLPQKHASYYGYDKPVAVYFEYEDIFIECDNWGLHRLLEGDTLEESKIKAKEKFDQNIDELYMTSMLAASALEDAKNSITIHGEVSKRFI